MCAGECGCTRAWGQNTVWCMSVHFSLCTRVCTGVQVACTHRGAEAGNAGAQWEALLREEMAQEGDPGGGRDQGARSPAVCAQAGPRGRRAPTRGPARGPCLLTGSQGSFEAQRHAAHGRPGPARPERLPVKSGKTTLFLDRPLALTRQTNRSSTSARISHALPGAQEHGAALSTGGGPGRRASWPSAPPARPGAPALPRPRAPPSAPPPRPGAPPLLPARLGQEHRPGCPSLAPGGGAGGGDAGLTQQVDPDVRPAPGPPLEQHQRERAVVGLLHLQLGPGCCGGGAGRTAPGQRPPASTPAPAPHPADSLPLLSTENFPGWAMGVSTWDQVMQRPCL